MGSTKNDIRSFKTMDTADLSADFNGIPTNINILDNVSVHIQCSAGVTGTFYIQGSNVPGHSGIIGNGPGSTDWVTIPLFDSSGTAVTMTVSGTAADFLCNLQQLAFSFVRVIFTFTSGSGIGNAWLTAKSI